MLATGEKYGYNRQMKKATISDTKNRLSHYIGLAKRGETVLITDHGKPVACLQSVARSKEQDSEGRLYRLEHSGVLRVAERPLDKSFLRRPLPKLKGGASLLKALLDEREEAR